MDISLPYEDELHFRATLACLSCRKQKRKCDKALPSCSLCKRLSKTCDYSDNTPAPNAEDYALLRRKIVELEARLDDKSAKDGSAQRPGLVTPESMSPKQLSPPASGIRAQSTFPAMFFLDTDIYKDSGLRVPRPVVGISAEILAALGTPMDIHSTIDHFFATVHLWLPIISKKRLELTLGKSNLEPTSDLALLLLTMKLVSQAATDGPFSAQTSLYWTAKAFYNLLESSALMSLQVLQSALLIATYEIGHAIYPAAYLTTGQCARLGYALGLHRRKTAPQVLKRSGSWAELEETHRAWWAVMLLDRYVNIGGNDRPLATEDPLRTHTLPANDALWDQGEITSSEPLFVSSPTSVKVGAFARTAQATHLLGRLIRLLNDCQDDSPMRFTEAEHILRTLTAFGHVLLPEVETAPQRFGTAIALCFAALIHLSEAFACTESNRGQHTVEETHMQEVAIVGLKGTAADALRLAQLLRHTMTIDIAAISPLTADCFYQAAAQYAWLVHETGETEMVLAYHALADVLLIIKQRWAVAGEYLNILEAGREILYDNNPALAVNAR